MLNFKLDLMEDKVEFFDATDLKVLEKKIEGKFEENKAILLEVHSVSHQMYVTEKGQTFYSAVVHFKRKK